MNTVKDLKDKKYKFHYDAGHGWLEVNLKDLCIAGIRDKVSAYSYYNKSKVYLEEDCDFTLFAEATGIGAGNIVEVNDGDWSFIRSFDKI